MNLSSIRRFSKEFVFIARKGSVVGGGGVCKTWRTDTEQRMRKKIPFRSDATDHKERFYK